MNKVNDGGDMSDAKLRDYFAGQALQGILARQYGDIPGTAMHKERDEQFPKFAATSYEIADAMIREREKAQ